MDSLFWLNVFYLRFVCGVLNGLVLLNIFLVNNLAVDIIVDNCNLGFVGCLDERFGMDHVCIELLEGDLWILLFEISIWLLSCLGYINVLDTIDIDAILA